MSNHDQNPYSYTNQPYGQQGSPFDAPATSPSAWSFGDQLPPQAPTNWNTPPAPYDYAHPALRAGASYDTAQPSWQYGDTAPAPAPWSYNTTLDSSFSGQGRLDATLAGNGNMATAWAGFGGPETQPRAVETPRHEALRAQVDHYTRIGHPAVDILVKLVPRTSKAGKAIAAYRAVGGVKGMQQTYGQLKSDIAAARQNPQEFLGQAKNVGKSVGKDIAATTIRGARDHALDHFGITYGKSRETGKNKLKIKFRKLGRAVTGLALPGAGKRLVIGSARAGWDAAKSSGLKHAQAGLQHLDNRYRNPTTW